jgi:hypothetical protein
MGTVSSEAKNWLSIQKLCQPQNAARLVKMAEHHRRYAEDRPNIYPGWSEVFIGDYVALDFANQYPEPHATKRRGEEVAKRERPILWLLFCGSI